MWVLFVLLSILVIPASTGAIFYNDTQTIEIGDGVPPPPKDKGEEYVFGNGNSGGLGSSLGGGDSVSGSGGEVVNGGDTNNTGVTSGTAGSSLEDAEDNILSLLEQSGAFEHTLGASILSSAGLGGGNPLGTGVLRIFARSVRDALSEHVDLKEFLGLWQRGGGALGGREYGLMAASTMLRDSGVQEVLFTASKVEVKYRSRGYLLAVIPWTFPVVVGITPEARVLEERITITLPWYRFFVREFFTVDGLRRELDLVLQEALEKPENQDDDLTAVVFETATAFLKRKVGTIPDTVIQSGQ